jgi:hypothetical protein
MHLTNFTLLHVNESEMTLIASDNSKSIFLSVLMYRQIKYTQIKCTGPCADEPGAHNVKQSA